MIGRRRRVHWRQRVAHSVLELLVVISIIVILLAMSAPVYLRAIKKARGVASGQR